MAIGVTEECHEVNEELARKLVSFPQARWNKSVIHMAAESLNKVWTRMMFQSSVIYLAWVYISHCCHHASEAEFTHLIVNMILNIKSSLNIAEQNMNMNLATTGWLTTMLI